MITEHSILAPSAAGIWGKPDGCTGYVGMAQKVPDIGDDEDAREGDATHEIGSELIQYAARGVTSTTAEEYVGEEASNGVIFTEEMFDAAKMYADNVTEVMRKIGVFGGENFGNEQRVKCPYISPVSFGTVDQYLIDSRSDGVDLYLWDFKFGHEYVEVFENWQLTNYTSGVIEDQARIENWDPKFVNVHFIIVQPRSFHRDGPIREWVTTLDVILKHIETLRTNAAIALGPNATLNTGSHCKHCQARYACPAAIKAGTGFYEVSMQPVPVDLTPEQVGVQLLMLERAFEHIKSQKSGFEEMVKHLKKSGKVVPGWLIEMGKGNEKWNKPVSEVIDLGNMLGFDLKKPDEAITPNAARKLGIDDAVIKEYSIVPNTKLKIVKDDGILLRQIFGDIKP